jgi:hypothetical protein
MKITSALFALFALAFTSVPAHAGIGLLGGVSFHNVSTSDSTSTPSPTADSKLGFVGGLAFSTNFVIANGEIDVLYNHRTLNFAGTSASSPAIEIPVLARFSFIPAVLDFGIGPYGAFNIGTNQLGYSSPDFGAVGSLRVTVPIPGFHLVIDGRYNYGFTDLANAPLIDVHTREWKVLAGFDIPFMGSSND